MKRFLVLGASVLLLGGCALPLPVQVASWALDGILYVTTEKSLADHGISVVAQKDCAVLRGVLNGGEFCRDFDDQGVALVDAGDGAGAGTVTGFAPGPGPNLAAAQALLADLVRAETDVDFDAVAARADTELAAYAGEARGESGGALLALDRSPSDGAATAEDLASFETAAGGTPGETSAVPADGLFIFPEDRANFKIVAAARPEETAPAPGAAREDVFALPEAPELSRAAGAEVDSQPEAGLYFVIGSFRERAHARELRRRYRALTPSVLAASLDVGRVYRVVVGPFGQDQAKRVHQRIYQAGISDSWAIRVRPGEWSMAMVEPPAEAPEVADLGDGMSAWNPMRYVRMLERLIY